MVVAQFRRSHAANLPYGFSCNLFHAPESIIYFTCTVSKKCFLSDQYGELNKKMDALNYVVCIWYTLLITKSKIYRNAVSLFFLAAILFSTIGIQRFRSTIDVSDYLLPNSVSAEYLKTAQNEQLSGIDPSFLQIFVNNVHNLTIEENRNKLEELVREYERSKYTFSFAGTSFWMREYVEFLGQSEMDVVRLWTEDLERWSSMNHIVMLFGPSLIFRNTTPDEYNRCSCKIVLWRCKFSLSINSQYLSDRPEAAQAMMKIAAQGRFAELEVVLVPPGISESEQLTTAEDVNLKSMLFCTCAVALLGVLFITELKTAIWLLIMIASINVVNIGLMGWLNIPLNLVTMLVLYTGVGISVDYSIHICTAFARSGEQQVHDRVALAIREAGFPIFQCAITTLAGILALHGIQVPMFGDFYHTILLVVLVGFVHGMVFLPALLMTTEDIKRLFRSRKTKTPEARGAHTFEN